MELTSHIARFEIERIYYNFLFKLTECPSQLSNYFNIFHFIYISNSNLKKKLYFVLLYKGFFFSCIFFLSNLTYLLLLFCTIENYLQLVNFYFFLLLKIGEYFTFSIFIPSVNDTGTLNSFFVKTLQELFFNITNYDLIY